MQGTKMTTAIESTVKVVLGFTVLWFIFVWVALIDNAEAVQRVTALSWRFAGPKIITPQSYDRMKSAVSGTSCEDYVASAELRHGIPEDLLQAVAKVESGKSDGKGQVVAWPWTVNVEGKGYSYPSKQAAIDAVKKFQAEGKKSIDVGCMQVNLLYHPKAFPTLSAAFDPHHNVEYAARFLKGLRNDQSNWHQAVAHYHSANPEHHIPYRQKVMSQWNKEKKIANKAPQDLRLVQAESVASQGKTHRLNDRKSYMGLEKNTNLQNGNVRKVTRAGTGRRSIAAQRQAMAPRIIRASDANLSTAKRVGRISRAVAKSH
ncbi:Lytic transglycosylase domain-containing protein [Candidatus Bealeia paramacronuclearis]|uniref:Lytic transglycosylase domain-containing protein n=1 Tax=Candidatus Bealeia paramacronuclearis TaxID=1921001 RepID=A0ABZ2C444_9PROT|nr:Lytic transglycosylase domain-containing protein [Candidatus Bealeia paramacronuclearis]